ncbi:MAG: MBOAT family O-acyltransferase [Lachnospiraceae bacterium]|nr:MBOAT family O-acyltransferase [Lachnospiraceae bacterium]
MQFNSFIYILMLLPFTVLAYFVGNKVNYTVGKIVIIISSILFYTNLDWNLLGVLGISLLVNYIFAIGISKRNKYCKCLVAAPIIINISLLFYYKYINFTITNLNLLFGKEWAIKDIILPLGISFFTFQQIAYIVAVHSNEVKKLSIVDYLAYILFFPKILMGPLMEPVEFLDQLNDSRVKKLNVENVAQGIKIFSLGLFKKVMIADVFANAVTWGYSNIGAATAMDWILISIFYTFEIYFDFSGYSDMAVGSALMLNITLPINFDSPYKALSIRDFWKRWHISLTKFFTKYVYIPLGGSRNGIFRTCVNTIIIFLISGIWHGSSWTFVIWGLIHGILMVISRLFEKIESKIYEPVRWFVTFNIVNYLWLLFRSESISQWKQLIKTILFMQNTSISDGLINSFVLPESTFIQNVLHLDFWINNIRGFWMIMYLLLSFIICLIPNNNYKKMKNLSAISIIIAAIAFVWGFICLSSESVFVYFNF